MSNNKPIRRIAIIGTGPMQDILEQADIDLLSDWVTAGAPIPPAAVS